MSLVNRMLKDLEARAPQPVRRPQEERVQQLSMTAAAAKTSPGRKVWFISSLLAILLLVLWYLY